VAIARSRRVAGLLRAEVGTDPATGKPTLAWWFDPAALAAEQATDGWYALVTNLDPAQADAAGVLARYKGQEVVERRYGAFKGPLAVAPMFLQSNRRIQALVTVICLALLIFCLVEREVRRAIAPAVRLDGLYLGQPAKPTGRLIFEALARLRLLPARGPHPPSAPPPDHPPPPPAASPTAAPAGRRPPPASLTNRRTRCTPATSTPYDSSCAKDPASRPPLPGVAGRRRRGGGGWPGRRSRTGWPRHRAGRGGRRTPGPGAGRGAGWAWACWGTGGARSGSSARRAASRPDGCRSRCGRSAPGVGGSPAGRPR